VVTLDRGRYGCLTDGRMVTAMKARELGRRSVAVGDRVLLAGDVSGAPDTLARIVRIQPRTSALRRSPDDNDPVERVIVANAELLVIVCSLAQPSPHLRFVDRCLVAAYDAGIKPLLCLTKADLASPDEVLSVYAPLGLAAHVTQRPLTADQLAGLQALLDGKISVMIGQSGVGKSTLVNALVPDADRVTGTVNPVTGRGRHTSSSAVALPLPDGGWIIDTPGVRGFGLGGVSPERVLEAFPDLAEGTAEDAADCDHLGPDCTLGPWAEAHGAQQRLDSLRRLLASRDAADAN
jgi:ribosome biogenesis GTPase / thiamine phosphate phosphatase